MSFDYLEYLDEHRIGYYVSCMNDSPCIVTSIGNENGNVDLDKFELPLRIDVPNEVSLCLRLLRKLTNADDMFFIVHIRAADIFILLDKDDIAIGFVDLIDSISYQIRDGALYEVSFNENNEQGKYYLNLN